MQVVRIAFGIQENFFSSAYLCIQNILFIRISSYFIIFTNNFFQDEFEVFFGWFGRVSPRHNQLAVQLVNGEQTNKVSMFFFH